MNHPANSPGQASLLGIFSTIFLLVFMVIMLAVTFFTFIQPESFVSEARIKLISKNNAIAPAVTTHINDTNLATTEAETIQSEAVLRNVVEEFDLNKHWGKLYASGDKLKTSESLALLKGRLDVRPIHNTSLLSIRVFSENRTEAAELANGVVQAYQKKSPEISPLVTVVILDVAHPALRPVRPNKPLNLSLGVIFGALVAGGCATVITILTINHRAKRRQKPPPPPDFGLKPLY